MDERFKQTKIAVVAAIFGLWLPSFCLGTLPASINHQPIPSLAPMISHVKDSIVNVLATTNGSTLEENLLDEEENPARDSDPNTPVPKRRSQKPKILKAMALGLL